MSVFNINDDYFKYQKCLSGITYQYVNQLDDIYEKNLMVGTNYCIYCMYNEFDVINNFMINFYQVDICCTGNTDLSQRYFQLDGAYLKTKHRVLLVGQNDTTQNDVYNVDSRGYLILSDELTETGKTWRYKSYVKLGYNKGKQFHLINIGNRFPLKGEKKQFLEGHGYIIKNFFNYNLFRTDSVPNLIFTDYEVSRISVNQNYNLYSGFTTLSIQNGGSITIKYHSGTTAYDYDPSGHSYKITATGNTSLYSYNGTTGSGTNNIFNSSGSTNFAGYDTYIQTDSTICSNAKINDYIKLSITGFTGTTTGLTSLELKSFVKRIESPYIIIKDYISEYIINEYYTGVTQSDYTFTNLMFSPTGNSFKDVMLESYWANYFNVSGITENGLDKLYVYPIEYNNNKYFDYDGLLFDVNTNNGILTGYIYGSTLEGAVISSGAGGSTTSDKTGYYILYLTPGTQTITTTYSHYYPSASIVAMISDDTQTLDFNMIHCTGITTGTVYDMSNNPIIGAGVTGGTTSVISDGSGIYTINNMLSGTQTFTCGASGYVSVTESSEVPDDGTLTKDFHLSSVPISPIITTEPITDITSTGATSGGNITSDGGSFIIERGICWSTSTSPTISDIHTSDGSGLGIFISNLTNLTSYQTYYIRAYATNSVGTSYGNEVTGKTLSVLATITTTSATDVNTSEATSGGNITNDGGTTVTDRGVCWSTSTNPTISNNHRSNGDGMGVFTISLTGLTNGTLYYIKAYAINSVGTAYGNEITIDTLELTLPIITTNSITNITTTGSTSGGNITSDGGAVVTARGVCWATAIDPTISNNIKASDSGGTGSYSINITGLTSYTNYYARSYATNSVGTAYGNNVAFETLPSIFAPTITTDAITDITTTGSTSGGNVTSDGGASVTTRGVCWSTLNNPTISNSHTIDGTGTGLFTSSLTGLDLNTTYYVRAYASNSVGITYGNEQSFTTNSIIIVAPSVITTEASFITTTGSTSGGKVTSDGGDTVTDRGICWSNSGTPDISNNHTSDGSGTGSFTSIITGLSSNVEYWVRSYAINSIDISYGNEISFITTIDVVLPTVTTTIISSITPTTARSGGNVISDGGDTVIERGVCWSTSPTPTISNSHTNNGVGEGVFLSDMTSLLPTTTYYVRAYATNSAGTAYGDEKTFATTAIAVLPSVTTTAASLITTTGATSGGNVTSDGGSTVTNRGVCWSTSTNPTTSNSHTSNGSGTGIFTSSLTGLLPTTTYYIRAYAINSVGTKYGNQLTFLTSTPVAIPSITTYEMTDITTTGATSGGNVTSDGGSSVTSRGVCWNTIGSPTTSNNKTVNGTGTGSFTSSLTSLASGTHYHVRAYATNSVGTSYGNEVTGTTSSIPTLPSVTTTAASLITQTGATSGGEVTNSGNTTVTARGVCYSTSPNPTTANNHTSNGNGIGVFTSSLTGLTNGTLYYIKAYAINSVGTAYGNELTFTSTANIPTLTTKEITSITINSASSGGDVISSGGTITSVGVCYSDYYNPPSKTNSSFTSNGYIFQPTFDSNISGLITNHSYYVRAYATNSAGTGYGSNVETFTTLNIPTVSTNSTTYVSATGATSGGNVTNSGGTTVTTRGICWSQYGIPTISDNHTASGSGLGSYTIIITGLTQSITYYVRAYATNSVGTAYGLDVTFTTPLGVPSVTTTSINGILSTTPWNSAKGKGYITSAGVYPVSTYGFCWVLGTGLYPTTGDTKTISAGPHTGLFSSDIGESPDELTPSTNYTGRAYAINAYGTAYGGIINFTTEAAP